MSYLCADGASTFCNSTSVGRKELSSIERCLISAQIVHCTIARCVIRAQMGHRPITKGLPDVRTLFLLALFQLSCILFGFFTALDVVVDVVE